MESKLLAISWLNGRFQAVSLVKGMPNGAWEAPGLVSETDDFAALFQEAAAQTGFRGLSVSMAVAHRRLTQQLVETPPVEGKDLQMFLERRVAQVKTFEEPAAYSFRLTLPTKSAHGVLLSLMPERLLVTLATGCAAARLHLLKLFPIPSIMASHLSILPIGQEDVVLLAAETEGITHLVVGRRDEQLLLGRPLQLSWESDWVRVSSEINRSILYVKQQFGIPVNRIWFIGPGREALARRMQETEEVPIEAGSGPAFEIDETYWLTEAARLDAEATDNLVSSEMQKAPQRRLFFRVTAAVVVLFVLAAFAAAAVVELLVRNQESALDRLKRREPQVQALKQEWEAKLGELEEKKKFLSALTKELRPPVPGFFVAYLASALPPELMVTRVSVFADGDLWSFVIQGEVSDPEDPSAAVILAGAVEVLKKRLVEGPFHAKILAPGTGSAAVQTALGVAAPERNTTRFSVEGVMR